MFSACDGVMIDKKYLGAFECWNIRWYVSKSFTNSISKRLYCDSLFLVLHKDINQFPDAWDCCYDSASKTPVFDRIVKTPDITAIRIIYEDDSSDYVLVPWKGRADNDYLNGLQESAINSPGHLFLCIGREKKLTDWVDLDSINDIACAGWSIEPD